jgi:hypothetical protein
MVRADQDLQHAIEPLADGGTRTFRTAVAGKHDLGICQQVVWLRHHLENARRLLYTAPARAGALRRRRGATVRQGRFPA